MTTFTISQTIGGTLVQFDLTVKGRKVTGTVTPAGGKPVIIGAEDHGRAHFPVAASADDLANSDASIAITANGACIQVNTGRVGYNDAFRYDLGSEEVTLIRQAQAA